MFNPFKTFFNRRKTKRSSVTEQELSDFLDEIYPFSDSFRLGTSSIEILDDTLFRKAALKHIHGEPPIEVHAFTTGKPTTSYGQSVVVRARQSHRVVHEIGHVIDRYSTGGDSLPFSYSKEFRQLFSKYCDELDSNKLASSTQVYLQDHSEAFALLFEHYCKEKLPNLSITQQLTPYANMLTGFYHNEKVSEYFDNILRNTNMNRTLADGLSDLSDNNIKEL